MKRESAFRASESGERRSSEAAERIRAPDPRGRENAGTRGERILRVDPTPGTMNAREGTNKAQAAALAAAVEPSVRHSHDDTRARSRSRDKSLETPPRNSSEPTRTSLRKPSSPEGGNLKRDGGAKRRLTSRTTPSADSDGDVSDDTQYERYASDRDDSSPRRREDDEDDEHEPREAYDPAADDHPGPPCNLRLEYWMRSEECTERKRAHVAAIDERGGYWGMEDHIEETVFAPHGDVVLERNMFPYETPRGISHWTLWSRSPMSERDIVRWTKAWLLEHLPDALRFNYDLNDNNSIDIPHYHVFIERPVSDDADEDERGAGEPGELVKDSSTNDSDEGFERKKEKRGRDETDSDAAPAAKAARFDRVEP